MIPGKNILFESNLSDFDFQVWTDENPLIFYHLRLDEFLKRRKPDLYHFFAIPRYIKEDNDYKITWENKLHADPVYKMTDLRGADLEKYREVLNHSLNELESLINELKRQETGASWSDILSKCILGVSDENVYCFEDKVCLAPWGMTRKEGSPQKEEPILSKDVDPSTIPSTEELNEEKKSDTQTEPPEENIDPYHPSKKEKDPRKSVTREEKSTNKKGNNNLWKWLLLGLGAIAVIFLLWFFFIKTDHFLPDEPNVIVPIQENEIGLNKDSLAYIATTRLNILIKDESLTVEAFSKKLKKEFPTKEVEIIYYDTIIKRLQLKIPSEKRDKIKDELKSRFSSEKILIFDEGIYKNDYTPNDQAFSVPALSWYFQPIQAYEAWEITRGNESLKAAIIDDGFDLNHEDFSGKKIKGINIGGNSNTILGPGDVGLHGTHVAGAVGSVMSNGKGSTGIAPLSEMLMLRVSDDAGMMSTTAVIDAVLTAIQQKVNVVNMSLGMRFGPEVQNLPERFQYDFIQHLMKEEEYVWNYIFSMADENNVTIVLAGGNEGILIGMDPMQRTPYTINVSSVNSNLQRSSFSNYGTYSTLSAPGEDIYNAVPGNKYMPLSGTSMAAPIVSGGVLLIKSKYPHLTNRQIANLLQNTGYNLNSSKQIGPLIQLADALNEGDNDSFINTPYMPPEDGNRSFPMPGIGFPPLLDETDCTFISEKIDSLNLLIEYYKRLCGDTVSDTLRIPPKVDNKDFLLGKWRSTTPLHNTSGEEVVIYFEFFSSKDDVLTLVEPNGNACRTSLETNLGNNQIVVNQLGRARCSNSDSYDPYYFNCEADADGTAQCYAQNKNSRINNFKFNLIRIR